MNIAKYFWDLNEAELAQTRRVVRDPAHPRFAQRMAALLSRCDRPKDLFSILPKEKFVEAWPRIRSLGSSRRASRRIGTGGTRSMNR